MKENGVVEADSKIPRSRSFGDHLYSPAVLAGHFLRELDEVVNSQTFTAAPMLPCRGQAKRIDPPNSRVLISKMLSLSFLCELREHQTAVQMG
jgi:hypothetical protein